MSEATRRSDWAEGWPAAMVEAVAAGYGRRLARSGVVLVAGECVRAGCGELVATGAGPAFCERCGAEVLEDLRPLLEGFGQLGAEDQARVMAMAASLATQQEGGREARVPEGWRPASSWDEADAAWRAGRCVRAADGYRPVVQPSVSTARTGSAVGSYLVAEGWR